MLPAPYGNYGRAAITMLFGILLLIPTGAAMYRYATGSGATTYGIYGSMALFLLAMTLFVVGFTIVQFIKTERILQAAERGDERLAPAMLTQSDPTLALRYGECIELTRTLPLGPYISGLAFFTVLGLVVLPVFGIGGLLAVYLADPKAVKWIGIQRIGQPNAHLPTLLPSLTSLEWGAVLLPLALVAAFFVALLYSEVSLRREVIVADDKGVSLQNFLSPRQVIPWEDMRALLRVHPRVPWDETYWLRGAHRGLTLSFTTSIEKRHGGFLNLGDFRYSPGDELYEAQVQRLLATIIVRGHVSVRVFANGYYERSKASVRSADGLTAHEALAMPLANAPYQPSAQAIERASMAVADITLATRPPRTTLLKGARFYSLLFSGIIAASLVFIQFTAPSRGNFFSLGGLALLVGCLVTFFFIGILITFQSYQNANPSLVADAAGIDAIGYNDKKIASLNWDVIRAWGVIPPDPLSRNSAAIYAIFTDHLAMQWTEPVDAQLAGHNVEGDRREAYHTRANALHALISAKTNLELREIVPRGSPPNPLHA